MPPAAAPSPSISPRPQPPCTAVDETIGIAIGKGVYNQSGGSNTITNDLDPWVTTPAAPAPTTRAAAACRSAVICCRPLRHRHLQPVSSTVTVRARRLTLAGYTAAACRHLHRCQRHLSVARCDDVGWTATAPSPNPAATSDSGNLTLVGTPAHRHLHHVQRQSHGWG